MTVVDQYWVHRYDFINKTSTCIAGYCNVNYCKKEWKEFLNDVWDALEAEDYTTDNLVMVLEVKTIYLDEDEYDEGLWFTYSERQMKAYHNPVKKYRLKGIKPLIRFAKRRCVDDLLPKRKLNKFLKQIGMKFEDILISSKG